ncbi:hypothetical protein I4F81_005904 [Pyropia yezoensis]|uniref:Uncharacterized protein n=1 Tax=Pyropia yezoensis TaxID=2788 RepID=A0ACC3C0Q7_PYRYE|nr:hypothetical protein I4F81_005904 [Neopyropia yezoensis]
MSTEDRLALLSVAIWVVAVAALAVALAFSAAEFAAAQRNPAVGVVIAPVADLRLPVVVESRALDYCTRIADGRSSLLLDGLVAEIAGAAAAFVDAGVLASAFPAAADAPALGFELADVVRAAASAERVLRRPSRAVSAADVADATAALNGARSFVCSVYFFSGVLYPVADAPDVAYRMDILQPFSLTTYTLDKRVDDRDGARWAPSTTSAVDVTRVAANSWRHAWVELRVDAFVERLIERRPTTSVSEFLADVFELIGLFTGLCVYTVVVMPAQMVARNKRMAERAVARDLHTAVRRE